MITKKDFIYLFKQKQRDMTTRVKHVRSNGVNDIFSFQGLNGVEYVTYPSSMEMNVSDVEADLF